MLPTYLTLALALAASSPSAPIIRRHDVPDARYRELAGDYPAVCHVGAEGVGVLIDPRWVLTASHVAAGVGPFTARVEFGGRGTHLPLRRCAVDRVILHPDFNGEGLQNDIALVRLAQPVQGIVPISLYTGSMEVGQQVVFVGCGDIGTGLTGAGPGDGFWRAATNTVREVRATQLRFQFDGPESEESTELEGFWGGGDSGCPAFMQVDERLFVAGVSSHGFDPREDGISANYGEGDVSYRVSHYASWIREVMRAQAGSARTIGEPQVVVDGQLPATQVGALASAYFDARTSDADMRAAFVDRYVQLPEDAGRDAIERCIWIGDMLPTDLGPYTLLEYVVQPDDTIVVSTSVPQIEERLVFTLRHGKDEPIMLFDVQVLPVPR